MAVYNRFKKINNEAIVDGGIQTDDIVDGTVVSSDFANNAVTADEIADGAVESVKLAASLDFSGKSITYRPIDAGDISNTANIAGSKLASGAAATNLGYTPVNKAGDTMTGQIRFPTGSAAAPAITPASDTNTGISFSGNQTILSSGADEGLRVNTSGQIQRANSVMFHSTGTSGWRYANSYGGDRGWRELNGNFGWSSYQRGGTNFANGRGRFTAPTAGFYQFQFQTYGYNNNNSTNNYIHLTFGINGGNAMVAGRTPHGIWMHGSHRNHAQGIYMDLATYLNAGQYVNVRVYWNGNQSRFHGAHSVFNGYMIG